MKHFIDIKDFSKEEILKMLEIIKEQGYSMHSRQRNKSYVGYTWTSDLTSLSVPIVRKNKHIVGAITIRYATPAVKKDKALRDFLPVMVKTASEIIEKIKAKRKSRKVKNVLN